MAEYLSSSAKLPGQNRSCPDSLDFKLKETSSGIQTSVDGQAFIPSSRRPDGTTRKEIKVRPGYKPPEDVETYKSRTTEHRRQNANRIPGVDDDDQKIPRVDETKNRNAKRREAARKKKDDDSGQDVGGLQTAAPTSDTKNQTADLDTTSATVDIQLPAIDQDQERQKKIRNNLKKLRAVHELKTKKATGEKLSTDQMMKISKEQEIVRDLLKLDYSGEELENLSAAVQTTSLSG
ncbi:hypothetical protein LTR64_003205 [Lithohypha guttulata]|uniref:WIBG Mago-binding domain-containing protein n=1 Tax=Lithohypha guttulata TaxID=1690604 RepID=A0AAN7SZW9_9EURO|nr:hypothetical protein LTR51_000573 [Lithohypha guttulata]KAK5085761.1 hypothetical protein LTR05_005049 [Lithohypha guttulata]